MKKFLTIEKLCENRIKCKINFSIKDTYFKQFKKKLFVHYMNEIFIKTYDNIF